MPLIAYLDEAGTASLTTIDGRFPVFGLGFLVVDGQAYVDQIVPDVTRLKIDTFGHDAVILHTTEMRHRSGDFSVLLDKAVREPFFDELNRIIDRSPFELIAVAIRKPEHVNRYGKNAYDPYELAMEFGMERLARYLEKAGQTAITLVAESRTKPENAALRAAFDKLMEHGSDYQKFGHIAFTLKFAPKNANSAGHQLADICINPIAKFAETRTRTTPCDVAMKKVMPYGLKIFP